MEREHDNLRAALDHLRTLDRRRELKLAGALGWFWHLRSHFSEGWTRLAEELAAVTEPDEARARALAAAGESPLGRRLNAARPLIEEAVALWRAREPTPEIAGALIELGWGCFYSGDADARRLMEEGFSLQQSVGDPLLVNRARIGLLQVLVSLGELDIVELMAHEALAVAQETRDLRSEHFAHHFLADCPLIRGDCASALPRYRRALALAGNERPLRDRCRNSGRPMAWRAADNGTRTAARGSGRSGIRRVAIDLSESSSGAHFWSVTSAARGWTSAKRQQTPLEEGWRTDFDYAIALALDGRVLVERYSA